MSSLQSIINKATQKDRVPKVLLLAYDGAFDILLAQTGCEFYCIFEWSHYDWGYLKNCVPSNFYFIQPHDILKYDYDYIIISSREKNIGKINELQQYFGLPMIVVEHEISKQNPFMAKKCIPSGISTISTHEVVGSSYLCDMNIQPTDSLRPRTNKDNDILIIGNFLQQDYHVIKALQNKFKTIVVGENPGLDCVVPKSFDELEDFYNRSRVYINFSTKVGVCFNTLKAYSHHCNVITTNTFPMSLILKDKSVIINDMNTLEKDIISSLNLYSDTNMASTNFVEQWSKILISNKDKIWIRT